ncbi:MAG: aminotransferase class I/II-fold pyridoxal phosphate-dependent enzyme, partial [Marivivens sp.]|nr:aminotransferase class I/II-fold pyridoxal phosphate-dependent enzyme [Marivivens sp.]
AYIPTPTYNEHAAAFDAAGKLANGDAANATSHVYVHPNNPDGKLWSSNIFGDRPLTVIDESFCDVWPEQSHIARAADEGIVVLKSFGKFWGLAGLRLGFMIAAPSFINQMKALQEPWSVNGPALEIGARALRDTAWAVDTRIRLNQDAQRLDDLMLRKGATLVGGTPLFRLYDVDDAANWQNRLAQNHIWSRIFPYSKTWIRLGLPAPNQWDQLEAAL